MPSPFPGMNPYLEHPDRWPTVHNRLIVGLADLLTPQLLPKYQVDIDKRVYETVGPSTVLIGRPDVTVQQSKIDRDMKSRQASVDLAKSPVQVTLPMTEEIHEPYLEVKDAETQRVVTTIEVLSPTNKRGDGRLKYLEKRNKILKTQTNFIEIDLLTQGEPLPLAESGINSHYRLLVSRATQRPIANLYPFDLPETIPSFPIPLTSGDLEPTVDLQMLLNDIYDRSGYDYFIDYQQDIGLPLAKKDIEWINEQLTKQGLRH